MNRVLLPLFGIFAIALPFASPAFAEDEAPNCETFGGSALTLTWPRKPSLAVCEANLEKVRQFYSLEASVGREYKTALAAGDPVRLKQASEAYCSVMGPTGQLMPAMNEIQDRCGAVRNRAFQTKLSNWMDGGFPKN
jgi:hypothetical protein